jgi:hypothetical protein
MTRIFGLAAALCLLLSATAAPAREPPTVWLCPDADSPDYTDLFAKPQLWAATRAHVDVFKFGPDAVEPRQAAVAGNYTDLVRLDAFRKLRQWNIDIAVEAPSVKGWDCTALGAAKAATIRFIKAVADAGAAIKLIAMDEPYVGGPGVCHLSLDETAARTAAYVKALQTDAAVATMAPGLAVGDIEPYPGRSVDQLVQWTRALERHGYKPAFMHLDVDVNDVVHRGAKLNLKADLQSLAAFWRGEHIPMGIIFWSGADPVPSDEAYFNHVVDWAKMVHASIGKPDQMIFQSWVTRGSARCVAGVRCNKANNFLCAPPDPPSCGRRSIPLNLPDSGPRVYSQTRLIAATLAILK